MTDSLSPELGYVLNVCKNIYQPLECSLDLSGIKIQNLEELKKVIKLAKDNGLVYHITESDPSLFSGARGNLTVERIINEESAVYEDYLGRLKETLVDINSILGERTFLVVKTIYSYPRTTKDVDILVSDVSAAMDGFLARGYTHSFTEPPYKETVIRKGGLSIALHECVAWKEVVPMEVKFLWEFPRDILFLGMNLRLLSVEADLVTLVAHIPFESVYFNLGDVLYMFELSKLADWQKIIAQARVNNWESTLQNIISILNGLHRSMYGSPSPIEKVIPTHRNVKAEFPLPCPLRMILRAHIEKGAWEKIFSLGSYMKKRSEVPKYVETYP
jgi:hypothetical protein